QKDLDKLKHFKECLSLIDTYALSKEFGPNFPKEADSVRKQVEFMVKEFPKDVTLLSEILLCTLQLILNPNERRVQSYKQLAEYLIKEKPHSKSAQALYVAMM